MERVHRRLADGEPVGSVDDLRVRLADIARQEAPLLGGGALEAVVDAVVSRSTGLGPLDAVLADPEVSEVMVNGDGPVWVERRGRLELLDLRLDPATVEHLIERVVRPLGLRVDRSSPMVDARLPDGSRVNAVVPPLAVDGPCLTIRRFSARPVLLAEVCPPGVDLLLAWAVRARLNVVVSGGTGAGKTTLLNALAGCIPSGERVVTVEDAAELRLPGAHVVRLEARAANAEGAGGVAIRDLVRNALRMRPDRIVVGECRGGEALDMLQAMNTGHEGSLSTVHANSPVDALRRLEVMVLTGATALPLDAVRQQVGAAVDLVVQIARRPDGSRAVVEVAEVDLDDPARVTTLATAAGLSALPRRPPRAPGSPPPANRWVVAAGGAR
ncbi:MAG TPA: CpaF family protein [Acidimicrobiales bacterium]|nr:CpaF family protein [Acidimicrobiales bacterium]